MIDVKIITCAAIKVITDDDTEQLIAIPDNINFSELKKALNIYFPNYKTVYLENTVGILNVYNKHE